MRKIPVLVFILCAVFVGAEQVEMPRFAIPTARSSGMGGTHVAYTDNVFSLLVNPAAMMRVEQRSFFSLSPTLYNPQDTFALIGTLPDMISGGDMSGLGNAMDTLSKQKGKLRMGFDLKEFPLSIAWVADGFGFGLWDRIFVNPNIIGTDVVLNAYADVILPVGFAFKILDTDAHTVDAGITIKPFTRAMVNKKLSIVDLMDNSSGLLDEMSVPVIVGAGFDIGLLYRWDVGLQAGITFDDIVTRGMVVTDILGNDTNTYYVPFSMNAGIAYDFRPGRFWPGLPGIVRSMGLTVALDWHDITNSFQQDDYLKRNSILDFGAGLQFSIFNDIIMVRVGMNEMLPACGLGFDLGPIELDVAYYGRELGNEPGELPVAAVDFTFAIRPDAKKRDWPWTRGSLVGLFQGSGKDK